jgi:hypothetical protein
MASSSEAEPVTVNHLVGGSIPSLPANTKPRVISGFSLLDRQISLSYHTTVNNYDSSQPLKEKTMDLFALFGVNQSAGQNTLLGIFDSQKGAISASGTIPKGQYEQFYISSYVLNQLKTAYAHEELFFFVPEGH